MRQLLELEEQSFSSDRISAQSFRRFLRRPSADGHGALVGDRLVGYSLLLFRGNSKRARVYSLAVDQKERGHGIGRALLQAAANLAQLRGCTTLQLEVSAANQPAIRLYESVGFRRVDMRKGYYQDGGDALVYQLGIGEARGTG